MTREEAIKMLKYNSNVIHRTINGKTDPNEVAALDMAIKALEQESTEMTAKEADNVKNSRLAIEAMRKQSCESYKFCKSCEDIAMAFQIGLLFGKADKAIEEVKKSITPQSCDDAISRQAALDDAGLGEFHRYDDYVKMRNYLKSLPSVTPMPKIGHWIKCIDDNGSSYYFCSACRCGEDYNFDFCPNCGSKNNE